MSTFERNGYQWRETYFVLFDVARRPKLLDVQRMLKKLNSRFELVDSVADESGRLESLTVVAPDDYAALDISYLAGEEVVEQGAELVKELKKTDLDDAERAKLARIPKLQAKFDLLHFERMAEAGFGAVGFGEAGFGEGGGADEEDPDEMLDPSALLIVLDALVDLTDGVGVDPQSGTIV